jgi:hypothetical protein
MPELKTKDGHQIYFDAGRIALVLADGAGAAIFGVLKGAIQVTEPPEAVLAGLGLTRDFVALTLPGNSHVWIKVALVMALRDPVKDEYPAAIKTVVVLDSAIDRYGVTEPMTAAADALKKAGAKL